MTIDSDTRRALWAWGAIVLCLVAVYWRVTQFEFLQYDDPDYVTQNPYVRAGVTGAGVAWAFGNLHGHYTYWHPLTWLSHMLDVEMFGLNAGAHHAVNLLLHCLNTGVLLLLLRRWTGEFWPSVIAAALWALHPLQVDSVAWVTERKNLLSALFWLLTMAAYGRYAEKPGPARYALVLLLMALGLMTKPVLVTLPFVLLLLDVWPLRRCVQLPFGLGLDVPESGEGNRRWPARTWPRLILEKVPLLMLAAASSAMTIVAHRNIDSLVASTGLPDRLANAVVSYGSYLGKVVVPASLAVFYPLPPSWPVATVLACTLVLVGISAFALWRGRRAPWLLIGWCWFLGVLVPTSGLIQVGSQAMADRWLYLPLVGLSIAIVWGGRQVLAWLGARARLTACVSFVLLAVYASVSSVQVRHWRNTETLFRHALQVTEGNYLAYAVLGSVLGQAGQREAAKAMFTRSFEIRPDFFESRTALANLHLAAQEYPEAVAQYEAVLRTKPNHVDALNGLGTALLATSRFTEAVTRFERVVELQPDSVPALGRLAWLLATHREDSVRNGRRAVELATRACDLTGYRDPLLLNTLAAAYAETGQFEQAVTTARQALAVAQSAGQSRLAEIIGKLLGLYQARTPYRE